MEQRRLLKVQQMSKKILENAEKSTKRVEQTFDTRLEAAKMLLKQEKDSNETTNVRISKSVLQFKKKKEF